MTKAEIQGELVRFICGNFLVEESEVACDKSLVDQGIIDSFGLIEIAAFIKAKYGIVTEQSGMNAANFGSVDKMTDYIMGKLDGRV